MSKECPGRRYQVYRLPRLHDCVQVMERPAGKASEFSNLWDSPGKLSADTWTNVNYYLLEDGDKLNVASCEKTVHALQ